MKCLPLLVGIKCTLFGNIPLLLISLSLLLRERLEAWEMISAILYVLIIYNVLAYSYWHIFNMGETARRIRMLYELSLAGRMKHSELENRYGVKNIIDVRLERLIAMKQILKHQKRFFLRSPLFYWIGVVILKWGFFLKYNVSLQQNLKKKVFQEYLQTMR